MPISSAATQTNKKDDNINKSEALKSEVVQTRDCQNRKQNINLYGLT